MKKVLLFGLVLGFAISFSSPCRAADAKAALTEDLIQELLRQGVTPEQIFGVDSNGIPLVSGTPALGEPAGLLTQQVVEGSLPAGARGWETIPGVIRNDGREAFQLEVNVNGPVSRVTLNNVLASLISPEAAPFDLRDDGLNGDRVAGDFVFTSGTFTYNTSFPIPSFYRFDATSPAGLHVIDVGTVTIEEIDGTQTQFLIGPSIGILRSNIPEIRSVQLSPEVVISPHLINIRSDTRETQRFLRFLGGNLSNLTNPIYQSLSDAFDFFTFFSTHKIEQLPRLSAPNFNAGVHGDAQVNYTGTGRFPFDNTAFFGSDGQLLGLNILDAYDRGILSNNATHELVHQWASFTSPSLGLTDETGVHYTNRSSIGSLVGGFLWIDNGDGTFTRDCTEGRNGAHNAPPLDKYMMGLIGGNEVPLVHVDRATGFICFGVDIIDDFFSVAIEDIQSVHGVRAPGPADAQRDFRIAFVVESHERLLNATEMTFYEILAEDYTKAVPPENPDPFLGFNWAPITRFFGEGTIWRSDIPLPRPPIVVQADLSIIKVDSPDPVRKVGDRLRFRLRIRNNGPSTATGVVVTDTLPANVKFVSAPRCSQKDGTVNCPLGNLPRRQAVTRQITVQPTAPGKLSNTATVTANEPDPHPGNNTATSITTVR